jgi:hypothetical protein
MPWYAVESTAMRTGRDSITYITAPNKQIAGEVLPGSVQVWGPYLSEAAAEKAHPEGASGSVPPVAGAPSIPPPVNANPSNPLGGLADIGNFFHELSEGATWERVGEVLLGGILVYAGIRALTHGSTVAGSGARKAATSPVKKAAKAAVTVAAPEARLATRVAAKRVAPKTTRRVAVHRENVRKYGAKKPYSPPKPRVSTPRVSHTVRESHIYHHKGPKKP